MALIAMETPHLIIFEWLRGKVIQVSMGSFALVFIIHSYSQVYNYQCRKTHFWQFLFHFILLINF